MITEGFIQEIRCYFNDLGIVAKNGITYEKFRAKAIKTLNRCKDLGSAKLAIYLYKYCTKKWNKIEKIFLYHLSRWQYYCYEKDSNIETIDDESSDGVYYITNAFTKNKDLFLTSKSLDDELYSFKFKNNKFILEADSDYYLKYSNTNYKTMKLFDKYDDLLCNIVLNNELDIFLKKNSTEYELITIQNENNDNTFIGVFKKSYIDSLESTDLIDVKNMVADIEWDVLNSKSYTGISKINLYQAVNDFPILLYFAASTFLLYESFNNAEQQKNINQNINTNIMMMNLLK